MTRLRLTLGIALLIGLRTDAGELAQYQTRYYVIHTDLSGDELREATIRMTKMAEEYAARTKGFSGAIRGKLPFYLFANSEDYYATGAPRESAGVFNGTVLMAVVSEVPARTWHIVQHEGFHQFAKAVIGGQIPPWVNEGLAEYFGEAVFTGDGFVSGVIPQWRLERIRKRFEQGEFMSIRQMMELPINRWNAELTLANYDQAWSMVQFLAHGQDGRYQQAFASFMGAIGKGKPWQVAWKQFFGSDMDGFEQQWREWWTKMPDYPTRRRYANATMASLTSYLARAFSQGQKFDDFGAFMRTVEAGQIRFHVEDWLPPTLLKQTIGEARELAKSGASFALVSAGGAKPPQLVCTLPDQTKLTGTFAIRGGRVQFVRVE